MIAYWKDTLNSRQVAFAIDAAEATRAIAKFPSEWSATPFAATPIVEARRINDALVGYVPRASAAEVSLYKREVR